MSFGAFARAVFAGIAQDTASASNAAPATGLVNFAEPRSQVHAGRFAGGASHALAADLVLHSRAMRMVNEQRMSYAAALLASQGTGMRFAEADSAPVTLIDRERLILREGAHKSTEGQDIVLSRSDLEATAAAYDRTQREAPLTLGKPVHDAPAYGFVRALKVSGDGQLVMEVGALDPTFASMVNERRYATRDVVFYTPRHPNNPKPGVWYLRHIGYMGAHQAMPSLGLKHA